MDKYEEWKKLNFTDPRFYDENNFLFIIHSIDLKHNTISQIHLINMGRQVGFENHSRDQNINLNIDPLRISEKRLISCSLISSTNGYETYKPYGFILKCPVENILCASDYDMGIPYLLPDEVINKYRNTVLPNPNVLILQSSRNYNEVVLQGSTEYGKVEIEGVFVNNNYFLMEEESFSEEVMEQARELSDMLNVPLIKLPKKKVVIEDEPINIFTEERLGIVIISFSKNNKIYRLFYQNKRAELQSSTSQKMNLMTREDFVVFMNEISKLKDEDLLKYKNIIDMLPSIFEQQFLESNTTVPKK